MNRHDENASVTTESMLVLQQRDENGVILDFFDFCVGGRKRHG
jgi:hypothetical protein